jgi:hypothetical protein
MYGRVSSPFLNEIKLFRNNQDRDYSGLHLAINPGFVWLSSPEGYPSFVE